MMTFTKILSPMQFFCMALLFCSVHVTSYAGLFDDEEARKAILDLRQKVDVINQDLEKKILSETQILREENAQLKRSLLDLQSAIEQARVDAAKQVGQFEQIAKEIGDVRDAHKRQRELDQTYHQAQEERVRKLEPRQISSDGKEFLADLLEVREFETALTWFRSGDFKMAALSYGDFVRRFPQSGYLSASLFWLGNAQYANRDFREALANFKTLVESFPTSAKAAEAMLAMANIQIELKDARSARRVFEDLIRIYPQSEAAIAAKDRLTRLK